MIKILNYLLLFLVFSSTLIAKTKVSFKFLTYNIHHGEGMDGKYDYKRLVKTILKERPDFVSLQEVDKLTRRSNKVDQSELIGKLTGMYPVFGKARGFQGGDYGVSILSKYPIEKSVLVPLPSNGLAEPRVLLVSHIFIKEFSFKLMIGSTHLCHKYEENRVSQAKAINLYFAKNNSHPAVLMGDFNSLVQTPTMDEFLGKFWGDSGIGRDDLKTSLNQRRIDYILHRKSDLWKVIEVDVIDDNITSDHRPYFSLLEIEA